MEPEQLPIDSPVTEQLANLERQILDIAHQNQGESLVLLTLLRQLAQIHQQVRDEFFYPALPDNRHGLAKVLRNIEESGGWPSIERVRLQAFLANLEWQAPQSSKDVLSSQDPS